MPDWVHEHQDLLKGAAALLLLFWLLGKIFKRRKHWRDAPVKVYCNHCNWEGMVTRNNMACARCKSKDLHVLAV